MSKTRWLVPLVTSALTPIAAQVWAADVGTAFTYQGSLEKPAGTPVTDTCDFRFGLWDAAAGGNQKGTSPQTETAVEIVAGVFTVPFLDFGPGAIDGTVRWLAIEVQCHGDGAFVPLSPRVELTPTPHALALPGLYTQQNATSPNVIGGHPLNGVSTGKVGSVVAGGGSTVFSEYNQVEGDFGTVSGGLGNTAGFAATVVGGQMNSATGNFSTVLGGATNVASGEYSLAAGLGAKAVHPGTLVWADGTELGLQSTAPNQFLIRASGGVGIGKATPTQQLDVAGTIASTGLSVTSGTVALPPSQIDSAEVSFNYAGSSSKGGAATDVSCINCITLGSETFGNYDATPDTIADDGVISDDDASDVLTINNGLLFAPTGGSVGIGTTTPTQKLDVAGTIASTGLSIASGTVSLPLNQIDAVEVSFNYAGSSTKGGPATDVSCVGCVNSAKILDDNITADDLAANSVTSVEIATDAVGPFELASNGGSLNKVSGGAMSNVSGNVRMTSTQAIEFLSSTESVRYSDGSLASGLHHGLYFTIAPSRNYVFGTYDGTTYTGDRMVISGSAPVVGFGRTNPGQPIHVGTDSTNGNGAHVTPGGVWTNGCDRESKTGFHAVDVQDILRRLVDLPVDTWRYKSEPETMRHVGPVAQDFYAAFGLGESDKYIGTVDADGVAIAAIQGLFQIVQEKDCRITELQEHNLELEARLARVEAFLDTSLGNKGETP